MVRNVWSFKPNSACLCILRKVQTVLTHKYLTPSCNKATNNPAVGVNGGVFGVSGLNVVDAALLGEGKGQKLPRQTGQDQKH